MWASRAGARFLGIAASLLLAACAPTAPKHPPAPAPELAPGRGIGIYKIGQPYQLAGLWYYPSTDLSYDETGLATVYDPNNHQPFTANGEIYTGQDLTAGHRTLPMPSIAEVTNLENGRSIELRINDRGPPQPGRLLALSPRAALYLDIGKQGVAKVHVKVLLAETLQAQSLAKLNGSESGVTPDPAPQAAPRDSLVAQELPPPVTLAGGKKQLPPPAEAKNLGAGKPATDPLFLNQGKPTPPGPTLPDRVIAYTVHPTALYVQAANYGSAAPATKLKTRLAGLGPVTIAATRVHGADQFRVRIGPLADIPTADAILAKLLSTGLPDARITVD